MCTDDGCVFDVVAIVPYIRKHRKHPVTGAALELKDLTRLHFHKNAQGEFHCPVLNKVFTESTHIVAVKTTGNVYSYQAVEELNIRAKNWKDLLTDEAFARKDLLVLQDPQHARARCVSDFDFVRNGLQPAASHSSLGAHPSGDLARTLQHLDTDASRQGARATRLPPRRVPLTRPRAALAAGGGGRAAEAERMLAALQQAASAPLEPAAGGERPAAPAGAAEARPSAARAGAVGSGSAPMRSSGALAASFTSSAMTPVTRNEAAAEDGTRVRAPTRKAYVALHTSCGELNVELHADVVPRACQNFLLLAQRGSYDGCTFHRSIHNFMLQGGDPTGTGKGGQSAWGRPFADEFSPKLSHSGRGVLSMANAGPGTNGSQFFILYKSAVHLDGKHTVFGRVVGGVETTLAAMERVPTDKDDRPKQPIVLTGVTVFDDPFADEAPKEKAAVPARTAAEELEDMRPGAWFSNPGAAYCTAAATSGAGVVGKFLPAQAPGGGADAQPAAKKAKAAPRPAGAGYGNFDGW